MGSHLPVAASGPPGRVAPDGPPRAGPLPCEEAAQRGKSSCQGHSPPPALTALTTSTDHVEEKEWVQFPDDQQTEKDQDSDDEPLLRDEDRTLPIREMARLLGN
ncbi:hypothetical protein GWK47_025476 [Chionoecetes opilio]|uniref:Uncharacterized protein n=1 Tax=Chionoecetes opilio TaxID=41210 RepID=A0A8J8WB19_CHIOP|nr:hypothetical protein GWK47_025476 [Chionoecetes opilio]